VASCGLGIDSGLRRWLEPAVLGAALGDHRAGLAGPGRRRMDGVADAMAHPRRAGRLAATGRHRRAAGLADDAGPVGGIAAVAGAGPVGLAGPAGVGGLGAGHAGAGDAGRGRQRAGAGHPRCRQAHRQRRRPRRACQPGVMPRV
jgi:hypothetical protein